MAEWRHWRSWYRTCALALCDEDARAELRRFTGQRWRRYAAVCAGLIQGDGCVPPDTDTWHDFETLLRLRNTRQGKAYKHWLFARVVSLDGDAARRAVEGGASLMMRDVVRERFRREYSRRGTISLDQPIPGSRPDSPPLEVLLPDRKPADDGVEQRDIRRLAQQTALILMRDILSNREKIVLFAREHGVSLQDPVLIAAAGCGKTVLFRTHHRALQTIARTVERQFQNESRTLQADLAVAAMQALGPMILEWARVEDALCGFFKYLREVPREYARSFDSKPDVSTLPAG